MQARTVALVGLLGLGLGWALGGRTPPGLSGAATGGRVSSGPRPLGVPPNVSYAPPEALKLPRTAPSRAPRPERNPFAFGGRRAPASTRAADVPPVVEAREAEVTREVAAVVPELRLTGMATTQGPDGPELIAIVHDGRTLVFLQRGDTVAGGLVVVDIQDTSVTLRDTSGGERTLRLR